MLQPNISAQSPSCVLRKRYPTGIQSLTFTGMVCNHFSFCSLFLFLFFFFFAVPEFVITVRCVLACPQMKSILAVYLQWCLQIVRNGRTEATFTIEGLQHKSQATPITALIFCFSVLSLSALDVRYHSRSVFCLIAPCSWDLLKQKPFQRKQTTRACNS